MQSFAPFWREARDRTGFLDRRDVVQVPEEYGVVHERNENISL